MGFIEYDLMTEKQKEAYKKYIIPGAKRYIEVYYDDFEDEWDSPVYEELYKEYLKLLKDEDYKGLYYFIISNNLYE